MTKRVILYLVLIPVIVFRFYAGAEDQPSRDDSFTWGNVTYLNIAVGEKITFGESEIELLAVKNHFNHLRVDHDTSWLKVSYRTPASVVGNLVIFVADNRNVAALDADISAHGLLNKDALIAVSPLASPLADNWAFSFPVSFTGGYVWKSDEDSYMFSYQGAGTSKPGRYPLFPGVGLDMVNARISEKHTILAVESGRVVWVDRSRDNKGQPKASLCIESRNSPGIYYLYHNLYEKSIDVTKNEKVEKGDPLGHIWGDGNWEYLRLVVVKSDTLPLPGTRTGNLVNFFPQLLELYYGRQPNSATIFTKGKISFGKPTGQKGNVKNASAFEDYLGTGWELGKWNTADKVEWISTRQNGNVRLSGNLFEGQPAHCTNPHNWYDYSINVKNGIYRIRALVGDLQMHSWQKIEFEGVVAGTYDLEPGQFTWTSEKIVRVTDGKLTTRIGLDQEGRVSGISEIVFQQASL